MTPENLKKFDDFVNKRITEQLGIQAAEIRKENEARGAELRESVTKQIREFSGGVVTRDGSGLTNAPTQKGLALAGMLRCLAATKGNTSQAATVAKDWGYDSDVQKALATQPLTAGGFIVPPAYSNELIELLYNRTAVRKLGATTMPMPNGTLTIPKLVAGKAASYIGENASDPAGAPTFGVITLAWKKLRATVAISNDLIKYSSPKADEVVRTDLTNQFATAEDQAFLTGAGSGTSPKGLKNWIANSTAATTADGSDLTKVIADLFACCARLERYNIPMNKPGWIFSPRTKYFLMQVRDSVGNFYFQAEMLRGTLLGTPFVSTNQVSNDDDGDASNKSHIYFGDFSDAIIGESSDLAFDVSQEASYDNGSGLSSAFALDQTVIRGIARHDFAVRRVESFTSIDTVKWGA